MRTAGRIVIGVGLLVVAVAFAPRLLPRPPAPRHIIVLSLDTTRADALGPWSDEERVSTPAIDALAAQSMLFERHYSSAPSTLASHTSLMTGMHPHHHGVASDDWPVPTENVLLQERLADLGFLSAAFLGATPLASRSGFTVGFDYVDEDLSQTRAPGHENRAERSGEEVVDAVLDWLQDWDGERPLLLFVHLFDAHAPYDPPADLAARLKVDGLPPDAGSMASIDQVRQLVRRGEPGAEQRVEELERLYLAGVSSADRAVGRLVEGLDAAGVLDDAVVILTADHGETFDRPEEVFDHGATVFDDTVHTPLIVRLPGGWGGGTRVSTVVSNVDIAPTLLDLLGQPVGGRMDGASLVDLLRGDPWAAWRPPAFAEATAPLGPDAKGWLNEPRQKMMRTDDHKLVWDPSGDHTWLFAPDLDPEELRGLQKREPAVAARMTDRLKAWAREAAPLRAGPARSDDGKAAPEGPGDVEEAPQRKRVER